MKLPIRQYFALLAQYLRPRWPAALALALLLVANIALQLITPQIVRQFIDEAQAGGALRALSTAALGYIALALLTQGVAVVETYVAENLGWSVTNELRSALARHCLRQDRAFHAMRRPGELIERIDGDVTALANFFSRFVVYFAGNALLLLGVLIVLFGVNWRVGVAIGFFAVAAVGLLLGLRNIAVPHWTARRAVSAEYFGFLGERLSGTEDIRASGAVAYVLRRLAEVQRRWLPLEVKAGLAWATADGSSVLIFTLGNALALGVSAMLYAQHQITIGTAYLIFQYTDLLRQPLEQIRTQMQDLQKATASISRVNDLLRIQPAINDGPGAALPAGALAVALDGVSFSYDDGGRVLHTVDVQIPAGSTLGVVGHTGSGKTTISRLLLRFHDPSEGVVRLGGVDLRQLRVAELRQRVGLVTQEVQLFHATLRENLTLFNPTIPDAAILAVLDDLGLGDWLRGLPDGLDSELAAGGGLSAGEGQLLAFARVFLRDPGVVILDEASSRLDPATERRVAHATERLLAGRTGVIIAHRLATLQRVDAIVFLEGGRVVEYGDRRQLAADPRSRFAQLLRTGMEVAYA